MVDKTPREQALDILRNAKQEIVKLPYFVDNINVIDKITAIEEFLFPVLQLAKDHPSSHCHCDFEECYDDEFMDGRESPWNG